MILIILYIQILIVFYMIKVRLSFFVLILVNSKSNILLNLYSFLTKLVQAIVIIVTVKTKYNFLLLVFQLYYLSALLLQIRSFKPVTIIIIIFYYINYYCILFIYYNFEKIKKFRLSTLFLLLYYYLILLSCYY